MWAGCLSDRLQRPAKPKRALIHESFCSGTLAEQIAFEGLTIPFQIVSASDKKALARRFIASRAGAQHLFKSMADQVAGEGFCCIHGKVCRLVGQSAACLVNLSPSTGAETEVLRSRPGLETTLVLQ